MKTELNIAVRTLVEQVCRGGDLVVEFSGAARSLEGIRGHQKVQQSRPDNYASEVAVSRRIESDHFFLNISGRIDGVYHTDDGVIIDEIKTTLRDPDTFSRDQYPLHWAQAKAYAAIYAAEREMDTIDVQLTYYQTGNGRIREFRETFAIGELTSFLGNLVDRYLEWAQILARWYGTRDDSIRSLLFPFQRYRPGQREMAVEIYRTIQSGRQVIIQAATGIGKTMAAVFPAVKALAEGLNSKIFYLTARTTGRAAAEQALDKLRSCGLRLKSVTLTAKDKICFNPESACNPDECAFARGHFDRIGSAVTSAFSNDGLTRQEILTLAGDHRVCPFEYSLELALWADCIICDYNYAFDPRVYLRRFFLDNTGNYTFLVDEAHNLVDRSREMFSAEIKKQAFLDMRKIVRDELPDLYHCLGKINAYLVKVRKTCQSSGGLLTEKKPPGDLYPLLRSFLRMGDRWLALNIRTAFRPDLLALYFTVSAFMRVSEQFDGSYAVCNEQSGRELRVKLFCMDPSGQMREALKRCRSALFFSATLTPADYFKQLFGCRQDTGHFALASPFPPRNLGLFIAHGVSTLYRHRERTALNVAKVLLSLVTHRQGNYLFYFPSYDYLDMVQGHFVTMASPMEIVSQTPGMSESEREFFVAGFTGTRSDTLVGFAVMGGIFGEGIDLMGDRLTGAAVIGVGLPGISPERELIRNHFSAVNGAGFEFAYLYPGMNRVLQAAGRVIRSESDRGTVLFIDQRYATRRYTSLFPSGWRPVRVRDASRLGAVLTRFWSRPVL